MKNLIIKISGLLMVLLFVAIAHADVGTSNPTHAFKPAAQPDYPFAVRKALQTPDASWGEVKKPYPSAAWFGNFALRGGTVEHPEKEVGMQPMFPTPYTIKNDGNGLAFSISASAFAKDEKGNVFAQIYAFDPQMKLSANENGEFKRSLVDVSDLSATLRYSLNDKQMSFPIVRGAPYITIFYNGLTPVIKPTSGPASINGQPPGAPIASSNRFELILNLPENNTQTWLIYSESPINLSWQNISGLWQLVAQTPYNGWIRMALVSDTKLGIKNDVALFDKYANTIPTAGDVKTDQDTITFTWKTNNGQAPLMMSLPHQRKLFGADTLATDKISYRVTQGQMQAVEGKSTWKMDLSLPKISFLELNDNEVAKIPADRRQAIIDAIKEESKSVTNTAQPDGPYGSGKRFARAARLALLADQFSKLDKSLVDVRKNITDEISKNLAAWVKGENKFIVKGEDGKDTTINNTLIYDTTWGGIIPTVDDFGSQIYNDHHFHYGYFVYTYAALTELAKSDNQLALWLKTPLNTLAGGNITPAEWIKILIRDYANPNRNDDYFPYARHIDFFNGHSYASGYDAAADGRNQESVSEAVNAYYALALLGDAQGNKELAHWGSLLMTQELNAAHTYWQVSKNSDIYAPEYASANDLATIVFDGKVDNHTWFGANKEYIYGIEMMPFNGFNSLLLKKPWIKDVYGALTAISLPNNNAWKWILIKGRIMSAPNADIAKEIWNEALQSPTGYYDGGDSKASTLYFITTQGMK